MLKEPDAVIEAREIKRRMSREANYDVDKFIAARKKWAKAQNFVYSKRPAYNAPIIRRKLAEMEARRKKIDAYLAKRAARTATTAKSA